MATKVTQMKTDGSANMQMTPNMLFDYMSILLDKKALATYDFSINVTLTDLKENYLVQVKNGILLVYEGTKSEKADISLTCPKNALLLIIASDQAMIEKTAKIEGDMELFKLFVSSMNQFPISGINGFNIIVP